MTEVLDHILLWMSLWRTIRLIFNGEIMMFCGWEAAAGQRGCIANVIRICARYGNLDILEEGYGINLLPLATFAMNTYKDDPCECFKLKRQSGLQCNGNVDGCKDA